MSLVTNLQAAFTRVATEFKTVRTQAFGGATADASGLNTTAKNLVGAINEILAQGTGGAHTLDDLTDVVIGSHSAGRGVRGEPRCLRQPRLSPLRRRPDELGG